VSSRRAIGAGLDSDLRCALADYLLRVRDALSQSARAPSSLRAIGAELSKLETQAPEVQRLAADTRELCCALAGASDADHENMLLPPGKPLNEPRSAPVLDTRSIARQALQAALAAGVASAVGRLLSYTRWYWAVLASFVIFSRASSRADTLIRGAHRLSGTLIGLGAGLTLVRLAHAHAAVAMPLLFAMLFVGIYFLRVSYAAMIACITCALALLYGVLGRPTTQLLEVRLEETAAGVAVGTLVAMCVLPIRARPLICARMAEVLRSIGEGLEQVASWLDGGRWQQGPIGAMRAVDRARQRLREAAAPFVSRLASLAFPQLTSEMLLVSALVYETRELLHDVARRASISEPGIRTQAAQRVRACAAELQQLRASIVAQPPSPPMAANLPLAEPELVPPPAEPSSWFARLSRLDEVLRGLRDTLAQPRPTT
jgi:uncharacterized membrane protein YccC